jgi:DNA-binding response OmpR family regulator
MIKILLIEDDPDDVELLEESLKARQIEFKLEVLPDGSAAVSHIRTCGNCPHIIVLDFNLPKVHGREVLLEIKSASLFKNIPLLILTTSSLKEDQDYSYKNGADKYMVKPSTLEQINETVQAIVDLTSPHT